jgi:1,4-dihydroxy-2-naphthoyl-CoA hydrolase
VPNAAHDPGVERGVENVVDAGVENVVEPAIPIEHSFVGLIGLDVDDSDAIGSVSARLPVVDAVCQPMGIVHGGVYAAISETLASMGTARGVRPNGGVPLGQANNTNFLRPVGEGTIHAVASAFHRGRTTWVWDVEMRDDDGRLCATSRVTIAVR